jgi:hypothetical protein
VLHPLDGTTRGLEETPDPPDLLPHADWIKDEVLGVLLDTDPSATKPIIVKRREATVARSASAHALERELLERVSK